MKRGRHRDLRWSFVDETEEALTISLVAVGILTQLSSHSLLDNAFLEVSIHGADR
jgi:hypothetical protein